MDRDRTGRADSIGPRRVSHLGQVLGVRHRAERDLLVIHAVRERSIPVAMVLSGGSAPMPSTAS